MKKFGMLKKVCESKVLSEDSNVFLFVWKDHKKFAVSSRSQAAAIWGPILFQKKGLIERHCDILHRPWDETVAAHFKGWHEVTNFSVSVDPL